MAGSNKPNDLVLAAQGAEAREALNRRLQTNLDLGRLIRFQPSYRASTGTWNLLMAILGGASTLTGPIVGAAIITLIKNVVSTYVERWNTLLGAIFVIVIMFMPYGLVPGCKQLWQRLTKSRKPAVVKPASEPAA